MKPYYSEKGIEIYLGDCREVLRGLPLGTCGDCEDSLEAEDSLSIHLAARHRVRPYCALTLTDPPYGVGYAAWDSKVIPPAEWLELCRRRARTVLVTPSNANQYAYPSPVWTLCWARPGSVQRAYGGGFSHWEPVLVYGDNPFTVDMRIFKAQTDEAGNGHPCPKPISVWKWLLETASSTNEIVLDPFMGSGTTLVAAKQLGRRAIGIEIHEPYCEISANRLRQSVLDFPPEPKPEQLEITE